MIASPPGTAATRTPIATALRRSVAGYTAEDLRADVLAGVVVGVVALPLSMALAIAVGAPPQHGLYTAIVGGFVASLLGGCRFQISGPTAAFVVILAPILEEHGLSGLLTAGLMAGLLLVTLGLARLGGLIRFVPYPVTTGFTAGIATVIATLQLRDAFGLSVAAMPDAWHEKVIALWEARGTASLAEFAVTAATLALLVGVPRYVRRVPAPLIALSAVTAATAALSVVGLDVATIGDRFASEVDGVTYRGVPPTLPRLAWPWGEHAPTFSMIRELFPAALAIAVLGAIESLLSAVIADGATDTRHDPDAELVGIGVANIVAPLFGGIAATGALARTATNIRAGARTPIAGMAHALVVLLAMLALAPFVARVPMASLAALLLVVAWNMSEARHFLGLLRVAPRSDVLVLVTCYGLTVLFDMTVAVAVGVVLAAMLFMRRMTELSTARFVDGLGGARGGEAPHLPPGVAMYEIDGPLFFGAAQKAMDTLHAAGADGFRVLILHLGRVPVIDATGFAALEDVVGRLTGAGRAVVVAGPLPEPRRVFDKADLPGHYADVYVEPSLEAAVDRAVRLAGVPPAAAPPIV